MQTNIPTRRHPKLAIEVRKYLPLVKISNEIKVGVIAIIGLLCLFLGYNFLKGKRLFDNSNIILGTYENVQGLTTSNPITINGLEVGSVYGIKPATDMRSISVQMSINPNINIPKNSIAIIKPNPLGVTSIEIKLGDANVYLKNKDTISTDATAGLLEDVMKKVDPVLYEVKKAVGSIDTLLLNVNSAIDPATKTNLQTTIANLNKLTASLIISAASLESMLNAQTGSVAKTMNNLNTITSNLANNNDKINHVMTNLDVTTEKLSKLELQKTLDTLNSAISHINTSMEKLNSKDGTMGLLLNDPSLYRNLASTSNKLNLLLDDIRLHPKRYMSFSVFGKKPKNEPLMVPLTDTLNAPYIIETKTD